MSRTRRPWLPFALLAAAAAAAFATGALTRWMQVRALPPPTPRIDVHTHVAPSATARAMNLFREAGIGWIVNLSGGPPGGPLESALEAAEATDGRMLVFTSLDWRGFGTDDWTRRAVAGLERARALGAAGLKIHKGLGLTLRDTEGRLVSVDDARLDAVFEAAGRLGLPVAIHTGDPVAFFGPPGPDNERWEELRLNPAWSHHGPDRPRWEALFQAFADRVARHPGTTFIGVHFGNAAERPDRVLELLDRHRNLYIDVAARLGELGREDVPGRREAVRRVFIRHPDRVLFGTDTGVAPGGLVLGAPSGEAPDARDAEAFFAAHTTFFETDTAGLPNPVPIQGAWTLRGLDLPEDVLEALYWRNAARLFGLEVTPGGREGAP